MENNLKKQDLPKVFINYLESKKLQYYNHNTKDNQINCIVKDEQQKEIMIVLVRYNSEDENPSEIASYEQVNQFYTMLNQFNHKGIRKALVSERISSNYYMFSFENSNDFLTAYIKNNNNGINPNKMEEIAIQILEVAEYLNQRNNFLDWQNLLNITIGNNLKIQICGAITSAIYSNNSLQQALSQEDALFQLFPYPPEIYELGSNNNEPINHCPKTDAYLIGVYLYHLCRGNNDHIKAMVKKERNFQVPKIQSNKLNRLLFLLLDPSIDSRVTASEALSIIRSPDLKMDDTKESQFNAIINSHQNSNSISKLISRNIQTSNQSKLQIYQDLLQAFDEAITKLDQHIDENKGVSLVIGVTGVGKTTVSSLLSGIKLKVNQNKSIGQSTLEYNNKEEAQGRKIATSPLESETRMPNHFDLDTGSIWDCPGFDDTNSELNLINSFFINYTVKNAKSIKIIMVIDCTSWMGSGGDNKSKQQRVVFETIFTMVKQKQIDLSKSMLVVFNRVPKTLQQSQIKENFDQILEKLLTKDDFISRFSNYATSRELREYIQNIKEAKSCFIPLLYEPEEIEILNEKINIIKSEILNLVPYIGTLNFAVSVNSLKQIHKMSIQFKKALKQSFYDLCNEIENVFRYCRFSNSEKNEIEQIAINFSENLSNSQVLEMFKVASMVFKTSFLEPLIEFFSQRQLISESSKQIINQKMDIIQYLTEVVFNKMLSSLSYNEEERIAFQSVILRYEFNYFKIDLLGNKQLTEKMIERHHQLMEERANVHINYSAKHGNSLVQNSIDYALEASKTLAAAAAVVAGGYGLYCGFMMLSPPVAAGVIGAYKYIVLPAIKKNNESIPF